MTLPLGYLIKIIDGSGIIQECYITTNSLEVVKNKTEFLGLILENNIEILKDKIKMKELK